MWAVSAVVHYMTAADASAIPADAPKTGGRSKKKRGSKKQPECPPFTVKDLELHPRSKLEKNVIAAGEHVLGCPLPTVIYKGFELDGYCHDQKIAIEVQGPLHYKFQPDRDMPAEYRQRLISDANKAQVCAADGILLIRVYQMEGYTSGNFVDYIRSRLYDAGRGERPDNYIEAKDPVPELPPGTIASPGTIVPPGTIIPPGTTAPPGTIVPPGLAYGNSQC